MSFVPGEGDGGSSMQGPTDGTLHPGQFQMPGTRPQPYHQQLKSLAAMAKGPATGDIMHSARDIAFSGHSMAQHYLRGAALFRGAPNV